MIINNAFFDRKIIIHLEGEIQIRLFRLLISKLMIENNIIDLNGVQLSCRKKARRIFEEALENKFIELKKDNIKPNMIYIPKYDYMIFNSGTIFTANKIETTIKTKDNARILRDSQLSLLNTKLNMKLFEYKFLKSKEFFSEYGKYLFDNNIDSRNEFIEKYQSLSNTNMYKWIKTIEF